MTVDQKKHMQTWIAALRSGTYKQTIDVLKRGDAFCCLGVACDLYHKETGRDRWGAKGYERDFPGQTTRPTYWQLPPDDLMRDYFGVTEPNGVPQVKDGRTGLTSSVTFLNDGGCPFHRIADLLEERYGV